MERAWKSGSGLFACLSCLALAACGGASATIVPDMSAPAVTLSGTVIDSVSTNALAGVSVCVYPANTVCTKTGADGKYSLQVPSSSRVAISFTLADYVNGMVGLSTGSAALTSNFQLITTVISAVLGQLLGVTVDNTKGVIAAAAQDSMGQALAGVSFTVTPLPAMAAGPFYFTGMPPMPDTKATATGSNGASTALNFPPSDYAVSATAMGKTCLPHATLSWPGTTAGTSKVSVVAATIFATTFTCN